MSKLYAKILIMNTHTCKHIDTHIYFPNFLHNLYFNYKEEDFPGGSAGRESTCSAGDPGSIPGMGRSAGEGIGYPLQYSWVSPVAQLVKNPPAMWEIWIQSLDWEDPLEKATTTHSSILAWRIP